MDEKYPRLFALLFLSQYAALVMGGNETANEAGLVVDKDSVCYKHYGDKIPPPVIEPKNIIKVDVSDVITTAELAGSEDTIKVLVNEKTSLKLNTGRNIVDFLVVGEGESHSWAYNIKVNDKPVFEHRFSGVESFFCNDEMYRYRIIFDATNRALEKALENLGDNLEKANRGDSGAQAAVGKIYFEGIGVEKDVRQAVSWFAKAAEQGNIYSQFKLGYIYSQNPAVYPQIKPDYKLAIEWYTKASEQGDHSAQHNLANIFEDRGETDKAIVLYFKAIQNSDSSYRDATWYMLEQILSVGYNKMKPEDGNPVAAWWAVPAEQGDLEAQHIMGIILGHPGLDNNDPQKSIYWYTRAANQGYGPSQHALGFIYLKGLGVPRDDTKAIEWWSKAAELGYGPSQHNLGWMYLVGVGVEKNPWEAYYWLRLAGGRHAIFAEQVLCQKDWVKDPDHVSSRRERRSRNRQR